MDLFTASWWKASLIRAGRTALVVAVPYVTASVAGAIPYLTILSAAAIAAFLSLVTSLFGISEVSGTERPWWFAVLARVVKTTAQAAIAGVGTAVLVTDVNWTLLGQNVLVAAFGSLLLGIITVLPEAPKPVLDNGTNASGVTTITNLNITPATPEAATAAVEAVQNKKETTL